VPGVHSPDTQAKISRATMVASLSMLNRARAGGQRGVCLLGPLLVAPDFHAAETRDEARPLP